MLRPNKRSHSTTNRQHVQTQAIYTVLVMNKKEVANTQHRQTHLEKERTHNVAWLDLISNKIETGIKYLIVCTKII